MSHSNISIENFAYVPLQAFVALIYGHKLLTNHLVKKEKKNQMEEMYLYVNLSGWAACCNYRQTLRDCLNRT